MLILPCHLAIKVTFLPEDGGIVFVRNSFITIIIIIITQSVLRQVHSLLYSEFSTQYDLVFVFKVHPVAAYAFFLVLPPFCLSLCLKNYNMEMKSRVLWDMTQVRLVHSQLRFEVACCRFLQGSETFGVMNSEDGGSEILGNACNCLSVNTASHRRRLEFSSTSL
jgi:hypothetical protein